MCKALWQGDAASQRKHFVRSFVRQNRLTYRLVVPYPKNILLCKIFLRVLKNVLARSSRGKTKKPHKATFCVLAGETRLGRSPA